MKPKKKSLVGWTYKNWSLSANRFGEITSSYLTKYKNDRGNQNIIKVRITIEEELK